MRLTVAALIFSLSGIAQASASDVQFQGINRSGFSQIEEWEKAEQARKAAESLGFISALFNQDCAFISAQVKFPAAIGNTVLKSPDEVIPKQNCRQGTSGLDAIKTLGQHGLMLTSFHVERFSAWREETPSSLFDKVSPQSGDPVVVLEFKSSVPLSPGQKAPVATILLTEDRTGYRIRGYAE